MYRVSTPPHGTINPQDMHIQPVSTFNGRPFTPPPNPPNLSQPSSSSSMPPRPQQASASAVFAREVIKPFVADRGDGRMTIKGDRNYSVTQHQYNEIIRLAQENRGLPKKERWSQQEIANEVGLSTQSTVSEVLKYAGVMYLGKK